jgi:GT2 family glycosyltransferase
MKVSIIIPTYNHCDDFLKPCIESIRQYTDLTDTEVIISANGCKDNTKEYVESLGEPFKLVWSEEAIGFPRSVNDGIKASIGDYVIILNNDTVLLEQAKNTWIRMMLGPFSDEKVGITGPTLLYSKELNRSFIIFFCACIKREVINRIGLLDEIFGIGGGDDIDFCLRAEDAGYKLVQVPFSDANKQAPGFQIGGFPIWHKGEGTMNDTNLINNWVETFYGNIKLVVEKRSKMEKEITFVIPSCSFKLLQECINSIIKYTDFKLVNSEFVIVCNGLPIEAKVWLDELKPPFRYLWYDERIGESASSNIGVKSSNSRFIAKMDDDNEILPTNINWIGCLLEPFKDEKVGLVGPAVFHYKNEFVDRGLCCTGFLMVTRREIWNKVGGLDPENILAGIGTDTDLSFKIVDLGYTISPPQNIQIPNWEASNGRFLGSFPIWHKSVFSHSVGALERREEKKKVLEEMLKERDKRLGIKWNTGYWEKNVDSSQHICSENLSKWIIGYLNKDKPTNDFGCGLGGYLKALKDSGFNNLTGYEGEIPDNKVFDNIKQQDLTEPFVVEQKGNCICLEVLEHIPNQVSDQALNNISSACDGKLILSWAHRGQGGIGHVNCLDGNEVINLLKTKGFRYLEEDSLKARASINDVNWLKNNIMIFEKENKGALHLTQILSFEIGKECNLSRYHAKCPINLVNRTDKSLTDDMIINLAKDAYNNLGFTGFISWSFYNEPMIHISRIFTLMETIRESIPKSRFLLWTNGTILVKDPRMDLFEQIYVTNYSNRQSQELIDHFGSRVLFKGEPQLDDRLNHYTEPDNKGCTLPFDNFLISNTGEVYICCMDWKNEIKIGSVFDLSLKELDENRREIINKISGKEMTDGAPDACVRCAFKWVIANFDKTIRDKALDEIDKL